MAALRLWKYGRITGLWRVERAVTPETADAWLARFSADEPNEAFVVSTRKPSRAPAPQAADVGYSAEQIAALMPGIDREIDRGGGWAQIKNCPGGSEFIWELIHRGVLEESGGFVRRPPVLRGLGEPLLQGLGFWEPQ